MVMSETKEQPLILDIKGNALDDGPGIRSVVFFKGCPLDCAWCHNPESKKVNAELFWESQKCVNCGDCIQSCPAGAISQDNPFHIDRERCTLCFECLDICPAQALKRVGRKMTVDEIVRQIVPYKPFFNTSGGGVTLSGGEPTMHMQFASALLMALKKEGIHTILETCGLFNLNKFKDVMLPYIDEIYIDVKLIDPVEHKRYCGISNKTILSNLLHLHEESRSGVFKLLPRTPLIPDITDRDGQIRALVEFYKKNNISSASLLPNNPVWMDKCAKLGKEAPFDRSTPIGAFYDQERKTRVKEHFSRRGISITFD
jgi:pyruvate formate lyase activating enzyme